MVVKKMTLIGNSSSSSWLLSAFSSQGTVRMLRVSSLCVDIKSHRPQEMVMEWIWKRHAWAHVFIVTFEIPASNCAGWTIRPTFSNLSSGCFNLMAGRRCSAQQANGGIKLDFEMRNELEERWNRGMPTTVNNKRYKRQGWEVTLFAQYVALFNRLNLLRIRIRNT